MRMALLPNSAKADAVAAAYALAGMLKTRAEAVVLQQPVEAALTALRPELVVVLGGDGSLLQVAQILGELGAPVVGINFGKLGYLAAFSMAEFQQHLDLILSGQAPVTQRLMLEGMICPNGAMAEGREGAEGGGSEGGGDEGAGGATFRHVALNDVVINAGEPFRLIEIQVRINQHVAATFRGDGVIVATSSGSTGYNLSAGGPVIMPDVAAMVLTPICAHSLSFRPLVLSDGATVVLHPRRVNPGTRVVFDGQVIQGLGEQQCVVVRRAAKALKLVENPSLSHWEMLGSKLHWARGPKT